MPTYKRLTAEERTKLWTNELNVARDGMRPWFEACKILQDQYNNAAPQSSTPSASRPTSSTVG